MTLTIRRAGAADAPTIVAFNRQLAEESEGKALDPALLDAGVRAGLADTAKALYFVAQRDGEIVGQLMLTNEWSDWRNGWLWWIQSVYIREDARRQGVFRSLYRHVEQMARENPEVIGLRLYVEHENHRAQRTYEGLGMSRTGYLVFERCPV